jgi:diguanylate cyclase (GGDEF)-like protein
VPRTSDGERGDMSGRGDGTTSGRRTAVPVGARALTHPRAIPVATAGLVLVLLALTGFSVTAAITNARAAQRAQVSAVVSDWAEQAREGLVLEEDLVDELKVRGPAADPDAPAEYDAARDTVQDALAGLKAAVHPSRRELVERWGLMHAQYGQAVQVMVAVGPTDPNRAEKFEERYLDPHFDPLESALTSEVKRLYAESNDALRDVGRFQQAMLVATPVVFGLGLALVLLFAVVLVRGRRLVLAQAEENRHQSLHDALTGLPNRTLLRDETERALAEARATGGAMTLLLVDLDRFKEINDTLGHRYGDRVLQVLAERLRTSLRGSGAVVGRLGGDEFAVVLPRVGVVERALAIALGVQATMDATIDAEGVSLDVDASIGLVVSGEHGDDVETLLQHADIAMYRAKERGLGVCVYHPELNDHSREQLALVGELRRAIDNRELVLEFQPKVTLPAARFCGAEALVRWQHPDRGLLPPGLFVPVAERTALIHPLTRYVLDAALAECRRWRDAGRELHVAVNVSVRNLLDDAFLDDVVALLDRWQVPASWLELEVTESAIMADPERARSVLTAFADLGLTLSIDDFGAGYTSLAHLSKLPVHTLKIDRSLVSRMTVEPSDALIVRSVIELGHSLGLRTVAEGVEDAATRDLLGRQGCDVAQGYFFSRPVPARDLVAWCDVPAQRSAARPVAPREPVEPAAPVEPARGVLPVPRKAPAAPAAPGTVAGCPDGPVPAGLLTAGSS